jgi:hypothetical protein
MTLRCEQIDVLLDNMEAATWIRHRQNPRDPTLARDLVAQTRALLRTVDLEHHVRICDHVQQLILGMECPDDPAGARLSGEPTFMHAASARAWVPDLGIPLVDDPFDLDAYPGDDDAPVAGEDDGEEGSPAATQRRRERERRLGVDSRASLRTGLTAKQLATLDTMALFGWTLEFVRRPMFLPLQPVAFDRNRQRFVVVDADGIAAEDPDVQLRA